jgi:hypothetical protein
MKTFPRIPNVFDLIVDLGSSQDFTVYRLMTPFGATETQAVTYRDTPIGVVSELMRYHNIVLGPFSRCSRVVRLAPTLRCSEPFPFPMPTSFEAALRALLNDIAVWTILCERDCDQETLHFFEAKTPEADRAIEQLFAFLRDEKCSSCPTFVVTKGEQAGSNEGRSRLRRTPRSRFG